MEVKSKGMRKVYYVLAGIALVFLMLFVVVYSRL